MSASLWRRRQHRGMPRRPSVHQGQTHAQKSVITITWEVFTWRESIWPPSGPWMIRDSRLCRTRQSQGLLPHPNSTNGAWSCISWPALVRARLQQSQRHKSIYDDEHSIRMVSNNRSVLHPWQPSIHRSWPSCQQQWSLCVPTRYSKSLWIRMEVSSWTRLRQTHI